MVIYNRAYVQILASDGRLNLYIRVALRDCRRFSLFFENKSSIDSSISVLIFLIKLCSLVPEL